MSLTKLDIDRFITTLRTKSKEFNSISNVQLASMLQETISNIKEVSFFWATICSDNKGTTKTPAEGEEWLGGPFASVLATQYYIKSLTIDDDLAEKKYNSEENSYKVFPNNFTERITFPFIDAKVIFNKSMSFDDINKYRGFSKRYDIDPSITLVLGAGNFSSIPYLDVLYHLITRKSVILLKLNPVNEYLKPVFEKVFQNFIERGYIIVTTGDIEESKYMATHPGINHIHLTGSDKTFEDIVYGRELTDRERKSKSLSKINNKPITSELGNVTPIIIHPGKWSTSDIKYQARKIVTAKLNNNGFNCIAAQVVVLPDGWGQTDTLIKFVKHYMSKAKERKAYYPESIERLEKLEKDKGYERVNALSCVTPHLTREIKAYSKFEIEEVWSSTIYFKKIEYTSIEDFADKAINYCNEELWGNLGVSVIIKDHDKKFNKHITNLYIDKLNYGTVAINEWAAIGYIIPQLPWGGFPGNSDNDIQSGQSVVHNSMLFESPLKGVVNTKFRISRIIDPPWFVTNKRARRLFKNLTYYQINNSNINFLKLIFAALI
ncbi:aldehyde dehydrogenase family protein [Acidimicrobiaceae bacterium]|nr:aldehyde dehydrogenase family protein [Acidimicrobiaceae bacterium]